MAKLGEPRVSNIDTTDTAPARFLSEMFEQVRDAELSAYPWNFAIKQVSLAKDATAPVWDWDNKYTLPSDFLGLLQIKSNPRYRMIENKIYTNEGAPLYIEYIARIEDVSLFSPLFIEAFAAKLAYELAEALVQSNTKKQIAYDDYRVHVKRAYAANAIQEYPQDMQTDTWITSRLDLSSEVPYNE